MINDVKPAHVQPYYLVAYGDNVVRTICKSNLGFASQTAKFSCREQEPEDREARQCHRGSAGLDQVTADQSLTDTRCAQWVGWSQDARLHFLLPSL